MQGIKQQIEDSLEYAGFGSGFWFYRGDAEVIGALFYNAGVNLLFPPDKTGQQRMVTDDIDQARIAVGKRDNLAYGAGTE